MLRRQAVAAVTLLSVPLLHCSSSSSDGSGDGPTTGGATGSGGSAGTSGTGGASGTSGVSGTGGTATPPPTVNDCDGLAPAGTFEEITPPEVKAGIGTKQPDGQTRGGTFAMAVDP